MIDQRSPVFVRQTARGLAKLGATASLAFLLAACSQGANTDASGSTGALWTPDNLFSFRAAKGKLDGHARLYQTIVKSFQVNVQWLNRYVQVVRALTQRQIQQIHQIGEFSRQLSRQSNEISDMMMQVYENRQAAYDRISTNFSQTIRGVDEWVDPARGTRTELPAGYDNAWVNGLGECVLSESPSYNPNIDSNQNWQRLTRK